MLRNDTEYFKGRMLCGNYLNGQINAASAVSQVEKHEQPQILQNEIHTKRRAGCSRRKWKWYFLVIRFAQSPALLFTTQELSSYTECTYETNNVINGLHDFSTIQLRSR
jgi:hypothetical protein